MSDFDGWDSDDLFGGSNGQSNSSLSDGFGNESNLDDMGDFGAEAQTADEVSDGKASVIKQAVIIIIIGIILALLTFGIIRVVKGGSDNPKTTVNNEQVTQENNDNQQTGNVSSGVTQQSPSGWSKFKKDTSISFEDSFISTTFTITGIEHYVKILEGENGLMVKTVLTGTLDGFRGTYELEVPYSKGCQLSIGNSFHVEAQVGSYGDNRVIGEIKY